MELCGNLWGSVAVAAALSPLAGPALGLRQQGWVLGRAGLVLARGGNEKAPIIPSGMNRP